MEHVKTRNKSQTQNTFGEGVNIHVKNYIRKCDHQPYLLGLPGSAAQRRVEERLLANGPGEGAAVAVVVGQDRDAAARPQRPEHLAEEEKVRMHSLYRCI